MKTKLSDFAKPLVAENRFIKASFGGFAGSGKSQTASEFTAGVYKDFGCTKPILIIDNERGSRYLEPFFKERGIKALVKNTTHLADVLQAFQFLQDNEIDFIFIDSLTKVWYQYVRDYRKNHNGRRMSLQDWGVIIPEWQEKFSDKMVDIKGNIVFTGRGGFEYDLEEIEENGKTKKQFVRSGVKMKLQGETQFETDINVWMETREEIDGSRVVRQWREALIMKDRSRTIDGKVFENPTYTHFKPAINFLMQIPVGTVEGATDKTNLAPSEIIPVNNKKKEQALESINNSFTQLGLNSRTDSDRKLLLDLWEMVFKTNSKSKVESYPLGTLLIAQDSLIEYKNRISILAEEGITITPEIYKEQLTKVLQENNLHEIIK